MSVPNQEFQPVSSANRLAGRDREFASLSERLSSLWKGAGSVVLIGGEIGIGKTALARAAAAEATRHGAVVLSGGCYDLTSTPAYGPWTELVQSIPLDESFPEPPGPLTGVPGEQTRLDQRDLFAEVRDFFRAIAQTRPLVLILEDMHWSDPASLDLLRYLARQFYGNRVLLLVTYRSDELHPRDHLNRMLPLLVREASAERLNLQPLTNEDVHQIVSRQLSLKPTDEARIVGFLTKHADGNPLYIHELLRTLEEEEILLPGRGSWTLGDLRDVPVPALVRQVIERRLDRLDDQQRGMLEIAAAIGHDVQLDLWQQLSGASNEVLNSTVERAVESNLMTSPSKGSTVRFSHALVRASLHEQTPLPRRRSIHVQAAELFSASSGTNPDTIADHFDQAGDSRALEWLVRAGRRAQRSNALLTAAERFDRASELLHTDDSRISERAWLMYRAARLKRFPDPQHSIDVLEQVEQLAGRAGDPVLAAYALVDRGFLHGTIGNLQSAISAVVEGNRALDVLPREQILDDQIREWVADALPAGPEVDTARDESPSGLAHFNPRRGMLVQALAIAGRLDEAVSIGESYLAELEAVRAKDNHVMSALLDTVVGLATAYSFLGNLDAARVAFERTRQTGMRLSHPMLVRIVYATLERVALPYETEDLAWRRELERELIELAQDHYDALLIGSPSHVTNFKMLWVEGRWDEALDQANVTLGSVFREHRYYTRIAMGQIYRARGAFASAWQQVNEVLPLGPATRPCDLELRPALEAQQLAIGLALDQGDLEEAREWLDANDSWLAWSGAILTRAESLLLWSRYHSLTGDLDSAVQRADEALEVAQSPRQPLALIFAHRLAGELSIKRGNLAVADEHLQTSLSIAESCAAPFERALTLHSMSKLRAASGHVSEAKAALENVMEVCEPLGARPALARATELAERLANRRKRERHPSGLTARQIDVLRLIARGKSDREIAGELFISHHTVMRHVSHILSKLNVESRSAAAAEAVRLGIV